MDPLLIYSPRYSPRLKYVLDWLLKERLQLDYKITNDKRDTEAHSFFIAYGEPLQNSISIPAAGLLWETGIEKQEPAIGNWSELPTIFATEDKGYTFSFDLLYAIFYLLSRYEEYYPFTPDKHERYPATASILHRKGLLMRPLVDEWVAAFRKLLQSAAGEAIEGTPFMYQPTYDIDMAYSHLHKGIGRIVGAYIRAMIKMDVGQISERTQVLKKKQKDPYDSFRWLRQLHKMYDYKPLYFVLSADKTSAFDKNIHPQHPAMIRVIKNLVKDGDVGIHPSYYSAGKDILAKEKKMLEEIAAYHISISRQHYIKIKTPDTYRLLLQHGIVEDYSMGYGSHLGFRAGTGNSFYWYDLQNDQPTKLRIHPFCFMDTTARYEAKLSSSQAFDQLEEMSRRLAQTGSTLITVFHNFSLGSDAGWKGWRQAYENFLHEKTRSATVKQYHL